jgi:hypothetical protein
MSGMKLVTNDATDEDYWTKEDSQRMAQESLDFIKSYVVMTREEDYHFLVLWAAHTWIFDLFDSTPYLSISSVTMGSGKTTLFNVLTDLAYYPLSAVSINSANLFRLIDERPLTLLLDEVDAKGIDKSLLQIVNSGYKRGAKVLRLNNKQKPKEYTTYCPKAFAGIGQTLQPTIRDRSVEIWLHKATKAEIARVKHHKQAEAKIEAQSIRDAMSLWVDYFRVPEQVRMPSWLSGRTGDIWEPLFAIANDWGGPWPKRAEAAAKLLAVKDEEDEADPNIRLLADVREVFGQRQKIFVQDLLDGLLGLPDPLYEGPALDTLRHLTRQLRTTFGVQTSTLRIGPRQNKGYSRSDFSDLWDRYLAGQVITPEPRGRAVRPAKAVK